MGLPLRERAASSLSFSPPLGHLGEHPMRLVEGPAHPQGRVYVGERGPAGCRVVVIDDGEQAPLRPRTRDPLWSFSWGRPGASARELAWAMIYDSAHDRRLADDWCSELGATLIAHLPHDSFCVAAKDLLDWLCEDSLMVGRFGQ